jgi:hypothetical protein
LIRLDMQETDYDLSTKEKKESRMNGVELRSQGFSKKELFSQIEINASPEAVWSVLTDFASFPDWNPFMKRVTGEFVVGGKLNVRLQPPDSNGITFKPTILKLNRNREISWIGHLLVSGLFDGQHSLEIEKIDGRSVRFVQRETFAGLLVPFLNGMIKKSTARGFVEMNQALKNRVERIPN